MASSGPNASPSGSAEEMERRTLVSTLRGAAIKTLFVVGSAGLVLDSLRNSLTWYLGKFWGGMGITWQQMWTNLLKVVSILMPDVLMGHSLIH